MIQPKYKFGDKVVVKLKAKYNNSIQLEQEIIGLISVIKASGTSENDTYEYGITKDMPRCYHYGESPFIYIEESQIILAKD